MKRSYQDKHGMTICAGMTIRHDNGDTEKVVATTDAYGDEDLGVIATNQAFAEMHPYWPTECYSLSNFRMSEWEIVG